MAPKRRRAPSSSEASSEAAPPKRAGKKAAAKPAGKRAAAAPAVPEVRDEEWWATVEGAFDKAFLPEAFVTREAQDAAIREVLEGESASGDALFLYGPPGTGKTSMVNRILTDILEGWGAAEGVRAAALTCTSYKTPKLLMDELLGALGLDRTARGSLAAQWEWVERYMRNAAGKDLDLAHRGRGGAEADGAPPAKRRKAAAKPPPPSPPADASKLSMAALQEHCKTYKLDVPAVKRKQPYADALVAAAAASAVFIVLDEVDAFFAPPPKKLNLNPASKHNIADAAGVPTVEANSSREDIVCALLHLARSLGPSDKKLFVVCSSNEERMEGHNRVVQMIPRERRVHFPAYQKDQFAEIVRERLRATGRQAEELFAQNALEGVLMKVGSVANGDCRKLLEYMRKTLGTKAAASESVVQNALTVGDVAASLPYQNELERWFRTLGQRECLMVIAAMVMRARGDPPHTVQGLDEAFHRIYERFLGELPGGSDTTRITLGSLVSGTSKGYVSISRPAAKAKAGRGKKGAGVGGGCDIELSDSLHIDPALSPGDVHATLHKCARVDEQKATDVLVLKEILEHYFPHEDYLF